MFSVILVCLLGMVSAFLPPAPSTRDSCGVAEFQCGDQKCIPNKWRCDGDKDCRFGEDEAASLCLGARTCPRGSFTCVKDGACIPDSWLCDKHEDCKDGSDERECGVFTCASNEFACRSGRCIQATWKCDGEDDCGDGTDEEGCQPKPEKCSQDEIQCHSLNGGNCISKVWVCDGDSDCPDGEDELDCEKSVEVKSSIVEGNQTATKLATIKFKKVCSTNEFTCRDQHYCIHLGWVCDGDSDCPDGTDEDESRCPPRTRCQSHEFACKDGKQCIPGDMRCSGKAECMDYSDEAACDVSGKPEGKSCNTTTELDCFGDGEKCVSLSTVCDGNNDCGGWEDEPKDGSCQVNECKQNNGGCQQVCVDTPNRFKCYCNTGFNLVNTTHCEDIDECETDGICSQICINRIGSYKCDCVEGYIKDPVTGRCKAVSGLPSLLLAHHSELRQFSPDRDLMKPLMTGLRAATSLDYSQKEQRIVWADLSREEILTAPLPGPEATQSMTGSSAVTLVSSAVVTGDGLAVDWVHSQLYWADSRDNAISVTSLMGGQKPRVLVRDGLQEPRAIVVHPGKGWMFWSDWGTDPKIERAGMDGSHREAIIKESVKWPSGLTLDLVKERLYWVDAKLHTIGCSGLDGAQPKVVLFSRSALSHPFSVSVFEDFVYWTDWPSKALFRADKFNGANVTKLIGGMSHNPMSVKVLHSLVQPSYPSGCPSLTCSHLCLPGPTLGPGRLPKASCACPQDTELQKDSHTCSTSILGEAKVTAVLEDDSSSNVVLVCGVLGSLTVVCLAVATIAWYVLRRRRDKRTATFKFENPGFRRPNESGACAETRVSTIELGSSPVLTAINSEINPASLPDTSSPNLLT